MSEACIPATSNIKRGRRVTTGTSAHKRGDGDGAGAGDGGNAPNTGGVFAAVHYLGAQHGHIHALDLIAQLAWAQLA